MGEEEAWELLAEAITGCDKDAVRESDTKGSGE